MWSQRCTVRGLVLLAVCAACSRRHEDTPHAAASTAPVRPAPTPSAAPPPAASAPTVDSAAVAALRDYVVRANSSAGPHEYERSPEQFAKGMKGTLVCGKQRCRAGRQLCVVSPGDDAAPHCEPIGEWLDHRTPRPKSGFPPLAGITACDGSHNCPQGSVCCLHEIGMAEVQAVVCHASLGECRDGAEACSEGVAGDCRTPDTRCAEYQCVPK